jgi:hypothetical protein
MPSYIRPVVFMVPVVLMCVVWTAYKAEHQLAHAMNGVMNVDTACAA